MKDKTSVIYCSSLISNRMMDYLFQTSGEVPMQSTFKFHKLFVEGFAYNGCDVKTVSGIPVVQASNRKRLWFFKKENENGITYHYPPFVNITFVKHFMVFFFGFFLLIYLIFKSKYRSCLVIDVLSSSISIAALMAAKITGTKTIGIVTDLPQMIQQTLNISKLSLIESISYRLTRNLIKKYDGYVFLTEQMNQFVNTRNKPYCIIEGLVDIQLKTTNTNTVKKHPRVILYSGGLYEKYGAKILIEAFMKLTLTDIQLSLYGNGDMVADILKYCEKDKRIVYYGVVPNQQIVEEQAAATLVVNPRPTKEEFTKYSFPSKNMEYMASGTPMVSTCLPGMPKEYYDYIFTFNEETVEGFTNTLNKILSISETDLFEKGQNGKNFVMEKKNNAIQAGKILNLFHKI
jgi:glycosyltransferase involved in cell wall biosynthesis